ncbi:MAG: transglycosylase domain-containing protein [Candidatus Saccharimonadales bacterium]
MKRQGKYTKRVTPTQHAKRHVRRRFQWWRSLSRKQRVAVVVTPILALLILIPLLTYLYFARDISNQERLMNRNNTGVVLYANDGSTEIYSMGRAKHRDMVPVDNISQYMRDALIASEDKNFYKHGGFSIFSTLRAVYGYILNRGGGFGGSTLTQQLAKITVLSSNRSFLRQYQAFSVALAIENTYSKDQILEMYLNSAFFGGNSFGVEDAAKVHFNKSPADLTLGESAMLVGLLPAPNVYSPLFGNMEYAKKRQSTVLTHMVNDGMITAEQKQAALDEQLPLQEARPLADSSKAPHFTEMVMNQLYKKYGEETVLRSGYQVITTLDMSAQDDLRSAIDSNMATIRRNGGSNASAVAIDPTTGEIRGLIGSYDWGDETFGKVNMATTDRQPGSSFKPIYYAQGLADGVITPATILNDEKTDFGGYTPQNADRRFRGDVSVRNALSWSLNIPAVKVMQKVGVEKTVQTARKMGLVIDTSKDYGLSLALGVAEQSLLQMTDAYAGFANQGVQYDTTAITMIKSKYGEKVYTAKESSSRTISEQGAYLISNILSDNAARASVFGGSLNVYDAKTSAVKKVAVKTGTTDESRDAWAIGYTPQMAVGVWVGNNDNAPMANGGSIMAGPIFTKAMGSIMAGVDTTFAVPGGVVQRDVCSNGGLADASVAGKTHTEWFISTYLPQLRCSVKPAEVPKDDTPKDDNEEITETTMTLTSSPSSPIAPGTSITLTATIAPAAAQGTVVFRDSGSALGTITVVNGTATLTTASLVSGSHQITATFVPSSTLYASATQTITVIVDTAGSGDGGSSGNSGQSSGTRGRVP